MSSQIKNDRAAWVQDPSVECSISPEIVNRPWRLVLLGAPGVGKGTQADLLGHRLKACHLSTGDVFRAAGSPCSRKPTPAMTEALKHMRRGELVPDTTVWEIVRERAGCIRCRAGFVLDGFPRTRRQAEAFAQFLNQEGMRLDAVLNYELPKPVIISRLSGRRVCEKCKAGFHVVHCPPRVADVCDHCGGRLIQREDDRPEAVSVRLEAYERDTAPLIRFYRQLGILLSVDAIGSPEEVFAQSIAALQMAITDGVLHVHNPREAIVGLSIHTEDVESDPDEL